MPSITNLEVKVQTGTTNSYVATWSFAEQKIVNNTTIGVGSLVSIKPNSSYYNGVAIPDFVLSDRWYVIEVYGDRAVLGENASRTSNICSAINVANLDGGSGTENVSDTLDHFSVVWLYDSGDGIWYRGNSEDTKEKYATYTVPTNAVIVKLEVTPVSKTHKINDQDVQYWTGTTTTIEKYPDRLPPERIDTPSIEVKNFKMTASLTNISDPKTDKVEFLVYDGENVYQSGVGVVSTARVSFSCQLSPGGEYRVRARAINQVGSGQLYGEWSDYSESVATIPSPPDHILECRGNSKTSVYLSWTEVSTATEYVISYTTEKRYFDTSGEVNEIGGIKFARYELTGLESGKEYFFRIAASNDQGVSDWSEIKSVVLGTEPSAPTTWSSSTTVITGEPLTLYWIHNSADGSREVRAQLELTIGDTTTTVVVNNNTPDDSEEQPGKYVVDTSPYNEGTVIKWRVQTCGVTQIYGDYSVLRLVNVYAKPSLILHLKDATNTDISTVTSLPIKVEADTTPMSQKPTSYYVAIYSKSVYQDNDEYGNLKKVNENDEVYGRHFDLDTELTATLTAGDLDLHDGANYVLECTASMNSGLSASNSIFFTVKWVSKAYEPNAEIAIDPKLFIAYIQPYCRDADGALVNDVLLSIYRKEFDGSFVTIADDIDNLSNTVVTDPHPALDFARYRIVSKNQKTGALGYYDLPPYPVSGKSIVMQWNERRIVFATEDPNSMVEQPWTGSMLVLPYNIEISDSPSLDVEFVNYIGRENPITYYGTQKGYSSSWNTVIPKTDIDTLYMIRKLASWPGDVYVREPSGSGYWANVVVSYNQKFDDLTIPISFNIKRVEGGV